MNPLCVHITLEPVKGTMHCLHAVLCFDVWRPLNALVQDQLIALCILSSSCCRW